MKLSEKILYCRKKAGLSQETLADMIGVSRQAISKWETGAASPEIEKILFLAKAFHVTADWLLSEDDPVSQIHERVEPEKKDSGSIPRFMSRLVKRYGWLAGVYLFIMGGLVIVMGIFARISVKKMLPDWVDATLINNNPVYMMGMLFMVIGSVVMLAGVVLAVALKIKSKKG